MLDVTMKKNYDDILKETQKKINSLSSEASTTLSLAIETYEKLLKVSPGHLQAWYQLSRAYAMDKNRNSRKVLHALTRAIDLSPPIAQLARADKVFSWLRDSEDFKKIVKDSHKKS